MSLSTFSNQLADAVAVAAPSVVQVLGRRRPASGIVFDTNAVLTTGRAVGRENGLKVRTPDGRTLDAQLAGWDPATHLAVLRADGLDVPAAKPTDAPVRVGHVVLALARSWSNAVTATLGNVAVIGGPLPTGRGHAIDEVIRTSAPMHGGFAGGALVDAAGGVIGVATAAEIRGLGVVIPAAIAWKAARQILDHGQVRRGYLGLAGQAVKLGDRQRRSSGPESVLLVVGLTPDSPADRAGLLVGDLVTSLDESPIDSADRLLEVLTGDRIGQKVTLGILRGGTPATVDVTVGERP